MLNSQVIVDRLFYNKYGQIFVSALFGISLALLFSRVCKDNCTLYFAPKYDEIDNKIFKLNDNCYKYKSFNVPCNNKALEQYDGHIKPSNQISQKGFMDKLFA
jgi:hypothetical protein